MPREFGEVWRSVYENRVGGAWTKIESAGMSFRGALEMILDEQIMSEERQKSTPRTENYGRVDWL